MIIHPFPRNVEAGLNICSEHCSGLGSRCEGFVELVVISISLYVEAALRLNPLVEAAGVDVKEDRSQDRSLRCSEFQDDLV